MKLFFSYVIALFIYNTALTQNCTLSFKGKVTDFHDNKPIVDASIYIVDLGKYTTTNSNGEFEFKGLCSNKLVIEIKHISCQTKRITIHLSKNIFKEFFLEHHLNELNEVVIKTSSKTEKTGIEQSINKKIIDNFSDKSLGDALNTISGVSSLNTGNSIVKPMIHGLHSSRLLLINNNVRMFDQEWGDEHAPNIDINASDRIDVIKGANTLKHGSDAIGGMVLIRPKKYRIKDSIFGSSLVALSSNGLGRSLNSEIIKTYKSGFYKKLQISTKQFGDFKASNYSLTNSGLENFNASLRFGYNSFEKGFHTYYSFVNNEFAILQSSHIGNVNDLVLAINNKKPRVIEDFSFSINNPRQTILHHLGKIEAYKRFKGFGKLTIQYDFQINRRKEFDTRRGNLKNTPVTDLQLFTNSLQSDLQIDYSDNLKINTGILLRYQQNVSFNTGVKALIPDFSKYEAGFYTIGNYNMNESSKISAGIRYDFSHINARKKYNLTDWNETYNYDELFPEFELSIDNTRILTNPKFTFHNLSTSLGYSKQLENNIALFVNYGLASRVPNPSELFSDGLHHSAGRLEYGFLTMKKEVANKFVISLEKKNANFGFAISPYFKYVNDFIQLIPFGIDTNVRGSFPEWKYIQVNATILGVDIDLNKKIGNQFNYLGSLSFLKGDNITDNTPLIHMPATNFSNRISYTNNELNKLSISLAQKTILKQKRFPDYNFYTFNASTQQNDYVDISTTPPTYSVFSLNTSAVFKAFKTGDLQLEFNIENLFNTSYREHLNRQRYFADELGRNFNLKIKINY